MAFEPYRNLRKETIQKALMVPWRDGKLAAATYHNGAAVDLADCWKTPEDRRTVHGAIPDPVDALKGRYLFGGILFTHFGHILTESSSRLWAMDEVDGIVFHPGNRRPKKGAMQLLTDAFGPLPPIVMIPRPTELETLVVPEQGFGLKQMSAGAPEFRDLVDEKLRGRTLGTAKLYVSRSRFPSNGRFLLEERIERYLESEGYEVFHPQDHSFAEQVAKYRSARVILSSDNSAMFLAGMAMPKGGKVGIISRRLIGAGESLQELFRVAAEAEVTVFRHITRQWGRGIPLWDLSLLDFEALSTDLRDAGFVASIWQNPTPAEVARDLTRWSTHFGEDFAEKDLATATR